MKKILLISLLIYSINNFSQKLYKAVEKGDIEKVKELLQKGENVNEYSKNGLFPLWRATADNNYEISKLLIENKAKVNQLNKVPPAEGTAIELPCQEGYLDIVKLLVENGADINLKGFRGFTPIRIAARNGHLEIVKYLAESGAKIDIKAMDGATPFAHAATKGHIDIVKYLFEKGANVNNIDKEGDFPVGEAARSGYIEVIQFLIDNGADLKLKNNKNQTAYDLAILGGQKKAAELIKSYL
ncbi:MAG: hypothetical protein HC854_12710 [Flavobacterium sp.]|nr:hypothetical protein [Flavobacterium sp.]